MKKLGENSLREQQVTDLDSQGVSHTVELAEAECSVMIVNMLNKQKKTVKKQANITNFRN